MEILIGAALLAALLVWLAASSRAAAAVRERRRRADALKRARFSRAAQIAETAVVRKPASGHTGFGRR